ncbi:MAG: UDP-2,3-diacylglucosamine diphosphatase [Lysobacteraceae bacterium]
MRAHLIADLHLDATRPQLTAILLRFLAGRARQADALLILGDLFEAWIGDDAADPMALDVAAALAELAGHGVAIGFVHGNRDFLLGAEYAARCGMRRLPDPCVLQLGGRITLLSHGDALCTGDHAYQAFRRQVRDPAWQAGFLAQPLPARRAFAAQARAASGEHQRSLDQQIADVDPAAVDTLFRRHGIDRLIHGHTHRPAEHHHHVDGRDCERIVLADWREAGEALHVDADGWRRIALTS